MSKDTAEETINALSTVSEEDVARLSELASDFAQDPEPIARRLRAQKARLETLRTTLEALSKAVAPENGKKLVTLVTDLATKSDAAVLAAQDLSRVEPLNGVGSATWQQLWEAARAYSAADAYPEVEFPNTSENALCVLCQQDLGEAAVERMRRFDAFIRDKTQKEEIAAKKVIQDFKDSLASAFISHKEITKIKLFLCDELGNQDLAKGTAPNRSSLKYMAPKIASNRSP